MRALPACTLLALLGAATGRGQLLEEEFDYPPGDTLSRHGWGAHSGAGTNPLLIVPGSLSFPGYRSFSLGNAVALAGSGGEDANRPFSPATSGELYGYLLVSASTARSGGEYFFHLIEGPGAGSSFVDKVWIKDNGSGAAQFGLTMRASSGATYSPLACAYNASHLLVIKHRFVQGTANDQVSLWIDPDVSQPEGPPSLLVNEPAGADPASLSLIALRQGGAATSAVLKIDAIRIGTLWGEPPAPVALVGFVARREAPGRVRLDWTTLSELNNYGFTVQKSDRRDEGFIPCPGMLHGAGTSTTSHSYTYTDSSGSAGNFYRLQQIDMDGTLRVSEAVAPSTTSVRRERLPDDPLLLSAYPNPFNPTTRLEYSSRGATDVELAIYDLLGRRVETLVSGRSRGGMSTTEWRGARHASGVYFARLSSPQGTRIVRLLLMK